MALAARSTKRWASRAGGLLTAVVVSSAAFAGPAVAGTHPPVHGSGSAWQAPAINAWSTTLANNGLTVNYSPVGSMTGRDQYIQGLVDFAASDLPFRNGHDKLAQTPPEVSHYGYSYVPGTAGGIALMYHLSVGGHLVRNLRLSARTLMEIYTGRIKNWDAAQITKEYGRKLPNLPIKPVVRSDGAGTTYYFTSWLAFMFARQWNSFCARVTDGRVKAPCGPTEFYPIHGRGWHAIGEFGGTADSDYLRSKVSNGAIGYIEDVYPLAKNWPVLRLRNPAGRYVEPIPADVTTALKAASIDENSRSPRFLQENLDRVFTNRDPASYPLSYFGYVIVPRTGTGVPLRFSKAKGRVLSKFLDYALCAGQRHLPRLGYARLPLNVSAAGLLEVGHIPGHVAVPPKSRCH